MPWLPTRKSAGCSCWRWWTAARRARRGPRHRPAWQDPPHRLRHPQPPQPPSKRGKTGRTPGAATTA
eukprot:3947773-Lingulodinium_polyedra.AAC.1